MRPSSILSFAQTRRHLPNRWDLLALVLLFGFLGWLVWCGAQMVTPYEVGQPLSISLNPNHLPSYAALTVMRILMALACSVLFTLTVGTLAAKNKNASKIIIPCIDILQSVPVLGFLSLTVTGFIRLFPGSRFGPECAAIFAIFTAQVWNMTLSFYQSLRSVPNDLVEATTLFQLSKWQRFWRLEVPFALPGLLWNIMLSMSGSWVFLVASESIAVANQTIHLPGIGSYLGLAISQGSLLSVAYAVSSMLLVILIYDQLFFRPLMTWSYKFTLQNNEAENKSRAWLTVILQRAHILQYLHHVFRYWNERFLNSTFFSKTARSPLRYIPTYKGGVKIMKWIQWLLSAYVVGLLLYFSQYIDWRETWYALTLGGITALRVVLVVLLGSCLWVPIGVWIGLRPRLTVIIQPIAQFLAAFPANVLFPLVVITLLKFKLPSEIGVLPLMLLGTQWYILFNVIAGMEAIPKDFYQMSQNLGVKGWVWWKRLILPGIFPSLIIGIMTAVGAAWNISVVAEVMQWGPTTLTATGLGAYIHQASQVGNFNQVAIGMIAMSIWVLMMNYCIWQPLYRIAQSKYRLT
jgi:NitT/TauT family transport system permease protein